MTDFLSIQLAIEGQQGAIAAKEAKEGLTFFIGLGGIEIEVIGNFSVNPSQ